MLLGAYAAKTCARATHNAWDATVPRPQWEPAADVQQRMDDGLRFETEVVAALLAAVPGAVDLGHLDGDKAAHIAETSAHLAAGTPLIIGGRLPDDVAGGRTGKPDLLVRGEDRPDGRPGYHPGDVKHHRTLQAGQGALVSGPEAPFLAAATADADRAARYREDDALQLAHYWRMLEAAGHAAAQPWGAVIGSDAEDVSAPLLVWHDLALPVFQTFSRSAGKARRSALERHDHEHEFRVRVAEVARRRTGADGDPEPLVEPIGHDECGGCRWASVCIDALPADDLSNELRKDLTIREYRALRAAGIRTVADLAAADPATLLTDDYRAETTHLRGLAGRLQKAHLHADLVATGELIRRRQDAPAVPVADVEFDVDCEWSTAGSVYLWGVLRTDGDAVTYVPFLDLSVADPAAEHDLTARFLRWLDEEVRTARDSGRSTAVYHYSAAELTQIRRVVAAAGRDLPALCAEASPDGWTDLLPYVRRSVDSRWGHGLKTVATEGAGFAWRDEDPGGLQSMLWFAQAVAGDAAAEARLLAYNEDDVRATAALRAWLVSSQSDIGSGS